MSASIPSDSSPPSLRFGTVHVSHGAPDDGVLVVEWVLKRNCSMAPMQVLAVYASLCVIALGIATYFWALGAKLVMPFAWFELLVVGAAWAFYARHASDVEKIALQPGRLTVEHQNGGRVERAEFTPDWVRVEPRRDDRSLVELSGRGQVIAVGRYVRPELRRALADEFRTALRRWPSGVVVAGA